MHRLRYGHKTSKQNERAEVVRIMSIHNTYLTKYTLCFAVKNRNTVLLLRTNSLDVVAL